MATRTASILTFLLLLLLAALASASIEEACRNASRLAVIRDGVPVHRDSCVEILGAAPGASTADGRGLAVIAGNLGAAHAQATLPTINNLLNCAGATTTLGPLLYSQEVYSAAVNNLKKAAALVGSNNFDDANKYFSVTMDAAVVCEHRFSEDQVPSPLTKANRKLLLLAAVGAALTHSVP